MPLRKRGHLSYGLHSGGGSGSGDVVSSGAGRSDSSRPYVPCDRCVRGASFDVGAWVRAGEAAETGRPGYDPRDLLKLYLYGYLHTLRSSRRLEAECRRNVEPMWLLGRLYPDHKSIAEFRRMHRDAVTAAGAELVRFAQSCGLIRGEWIAVDGTKLRAVSSIGSVRERRALEMYLDSCEKADSVRTQSRWLVCFRRAPGLPPTSLLHAAEPRVRPRPLSHTSLRSCAAPVRQ